MCVFKRVHVSGVVGGGVSRGVGEVWPRHRVCTSSSSTGSAGSYSKSRSVEYSSARVPP